MKIPNKQGLPKLALNHSPGIDFKDLVNLYIKCAV